MKKIIKWLDVNFEVLLCGLFFFAILIVILVQIFLRNIVGHGLQWAEEVARYLHVWVTYIGLAYSTRMNTHIKIDLVQRRLPVKVRKTLLMVLQIVLLILFCILFWGSVQDCVTIANRGNMAESMDVSQNWMYMAAPIGYALCILRLLQNFIWKAKTYKKSWELFEDVEGIYSGSLETFCYPDYVVEDMASARTETAMKELEEMNKAKGGNA